MSETLHTIDKETFEQIYRKYWKKIFGICFYRIGDEHIAEEIVQDIFHSLWERRERFVMNGPIEGYLVRAAKLEVLDFYRTGSRRSSIQQNALSSFSEIDDSTEQSIFEKDLQKHVEQLLYQLPHSCREIYQYSRVRGMKNREIAAHLSISIKTVEYHLCRALKFLKTNLQEYKV
ncbi:RNA polymerase sigma-70 factor [Sphingobacterium sp. LRF_L2]|uniref:RNA polymerase sigma-70 factor n=1 Tax=Sphingobacterium sp. LRF_L2 TaxID=3369421 RepID=UPI003F6282EA